MRQKHLLSSPTHWNAFKLCSQFVGTPPKDWTQYFEWRPSFQFHLCFCKFINNKKLQTNWSTIKTYVFVKLRSKFRQGSHPSIRVVILTLLINCNIHCFGDKNAVWVKLHVTVTPKWQRECYMLSTQTRVVLLVYTQGTSYTQIKFVCFTPPCTNQRKIQKEKNKWYMWLN